MDLPIRIRFIFTAKHRYAIRLKFGDKFVPSVTKLALEVKASISSTIAENLLSLLKFTVASSWHLSLLLYFNIFLQQGRSVSQRNTIYQGNH